MNIPLKNGNGTSYVTLREWTHIFLMCLFCVWKLYSLSLTVRNRSFFSFLPYCLLNIKQYLPLNHGFTYEIVFFSCSVSLQQRTCLYTITDTACQSVIIIIEKNMMKKKMYANSVNKIAAANNRQKQSFKIWRERRTNSWAQRYLFCVLQQFFILSFTAKPFCSILYRVACVFLLVCVYICVSIKSPLLKKGDALTFY